MKSLLLFGAARASYVVRTYVVRTRVVRASLVALASWGLLASAPAQASPSAPPLEVAAKAWLLMDVTSGQVLGSLKAQERVEPASITKLMTAYLTFAALRDGTIKLDQAVLPSSLILKVTKDESRMFIEPNKPVSVRDLLQGMIVQSGNDASLALAELVGGSEAGFVALMNQQAAALGMKDTHYVNPTGMPDPSHLTTAQDIAKLANRLIADFPEHYAYYSQKEFRYNNITQPNRNRLLFSDPSVDGLKTGHTQSAGFCLVSSAKRPLPQNPRMMRRMLAVVLGTESDAARAKESQKVLNYGFDTFDTIKLYAKGQVLATPEIWKGKRNQVQLGVAGDTFVSVPKGSLARLKPVLELPKTLYAPLQLGQVVGQVKLMDGAQVVAQYPVVALEAVPEASWFGRIWDLIRLWFKK